ncbi:acyl carrier protein [Campylobacter volucris]|uniref:acyl carrier protein n=1 Tax=Campylobacter volucris TaxID=1031542 RepID=UPI00189E7254|nr:acyl carrier protein [Campylobacter volucris]MBF7049336.1 acyl carrier protein [Campylobacter volucris]MBF7060472.1 acyl carrier protein [Campylobacter volucris]
MNKKEFLNALEEILNVPQNSLNENDKLDDFEEWDSIAYLEITVLFSKEFSIDVKPEEIKLSSTVKDLLGVCKLC